MVLHYGALRHCKLVPLGAANSGAAALPQYSEARQNTQRANLNLLKGIQCLRRYGEWFGAVPIPADCLGWSCCLGGWTQQPPIAT